MVFMQSVSRLLSRLSKLRFSYRMLWRDAYPLQLFPKVALHTGLICDDRSLPRMKQSDRGSSYFGFHGTKRQSFAVLRFYETEWHSFAVFWFLKYRVTRTSTWVLVTRHNDRTSRWVRVTVRDFLCSQWPV